MALLEWKCLGNYRNPKYYMRVTSQIGLKPRANSILSSIRISVSSFLGTYVERGPQKLDLARRVAQLARAPRADVLDVSGGDVEPFLRHVHEGVARPGVDWEEDSGRAPRSCHRSIE